MSPKLRPLTASPIVEIQVQVGRVIRDAKLDPDQLIFWMSIAEYLKDAQRWRYARDHQCPEDSTPTDFERFVDEQLRKIS